jgi:hypothetical protein
MYSQLSCGTPQNGIVQNFPSGDTGFSNNSTPICVNVQFHIVRTTAGTGGTAVATLDQVSNLLNNHLNPHNIFVNKIGFDYINNSTFYDMSDAQFNSLVAVNNNPNAINFYIINSCTNWIGRAGSITSRNLVMQNSYCTTGVSAHEFGHCLNLRHTFRGSPNEPIGCAELINGSNCLTCGDVICDTPADYYTVNSSGDRVPASGYSPDITNDMSYYSPSTLNHFSTLQGERMRDALNGSSVLQPIIDNLCKSIIGSSVLCSSPNQSYTLTNSVGSNAIWSVSSNLQIVSQNGQTVIIRPLSNSVNGSATITATFSNGQILTKTIWVGIPQFKEFYFYNSQSVTMCIAPIDYLTTSLPSHKVKAIFDGITNSEILVNSNWEWEIENNLIMINGTRDTRTICPMGTGFCSFRVRAKNACGWSDWYQISQFEITFPSTNYMRQSSNTYTIYPNPTKDIVNIDLRDQNNKPEKGVTILGELFDMMGQSNSKVEINNNKAIFSVRGLKKGIYVLKIYINNKVETHQIAVE